MANGSGQFLRLRSWWHVRCRKTKRTNKAMKTIVSTLIALSVLAGVTAAARAATDAKQLFEQQERWSGGGQ